jgi:hypothetical protein
VIHLKSTDQATITGRGLVKYCHVPKDISLEAGMHLKIDGILYRLHGIEQVTKLMYPPILSRSMGLVVTPIT